MKRGQPLKTTKPLPRKTGLVARKGLVARTGLKRTRLRPRSKKTQKLYDEQRIPFVIEFLAKHPYCQVLWDNHCTVWSVDVHERLMRSAGGAIVGEDDGQFIATCRYCHSMIDANPKEAKARGLRQ